VCVCPAVQWQRPETTTTASCCSRVCCVVFKLRRTFPGPVFLFSIAPPTSNYLAHASPMQHTRDVHFELGESAKISPDAGPQAHTSPSFLEGDVAATSVYLHSFSLRFLPFLLVGALLLLPSYIAFFGVPHRLRHQILPSSQYTLPLDLEPRPTT
jgi:hypothetical protein